MGCCRRVQRLLLHPDPGGVCLLLQRTGDHRARHDVGTRAQSPGPRRQRHWESSPRSPSSSRRISEKTGDVVGVNTTIRADAQQLYLDVDREKVKSLGVSLNDVFATLQTMLAYDYVNDFNLYGKTYHVQLEAQAPFRQRPEDIGKFYVRSAAGTMVPISSLVRTSFRAGPTVVTRFNGFTSALVIGTPGPGKSSGQMLDAAEKLIKDKYEAMNIGYGFSGESFQEKEASGQGGLVFGLGLVMAFLVLAAQYESWSTPFAVMIGVPFGILGAFLGLFVLRHPNDLYFDVGLLVVIGLEAKNAILMVEFAIEQRATGKSIEDAAVEAGRERIRPILMTSFAFILGVVPLVIATGAGAAARHSLGIGVFFGMVVSTLLGVNIIPNLFIFVRKLSERMAARRRAPAPAPATCRPHPPETTDVRRSSFAPAAVLLAAGCASVRTITARTRTHPPPTGRRLRWSTRCVRSSIRSAASRDSLAHAPGQGDTIAPPPPGEASGVRSGDARSFDLRLTDSATSVSWLDLFQDTVLRTLVLTAIQENRDVRTAVATIEEYRADVGIARAPMFPQISLTGQGGREKLAFGTFRLPAFELYSAAGNVSWALDFWGQFRRATQAAQADLLAQEESRRSVVLDLVSSVVHVLHPAARAGSGARDLATHAAVAAADAQVGERSVESGADLGARRAAVRGRRGRPRVAGRRFRAADRPAGECAERAPGPRAGCGPARSAHWPTS